MKWLDSIIDSIDMNFSKLQEILRAEMRWLYSITHSMDMNLSKLWEIVEDRGAWHAAVHEATKRRTHLVIKQQLQHIGVRFNYVV